MRDLLAVYVAVRPGGAVTSGDEVTRVQVVDPACLERVLPAGRQHVEVFSIAAGPTYTERSQGPELRQFWREKRYLAGNAGGERIELAHRRVVDRLSRQQGPGHHSIRHNVVEVPWRALR